MSKIDYQALREKAEKATCGVWSLEYGDGRFDGDYALIHREAAGYLPICRIEGAHPESGFDEDFQMEQQANAEFIAAANPATVLALLDELERKQQYIKRRDQENEDIALTVGKLRVELEGKDSKIANLTAERDALREGEMGDARHSNTRAAADIYFQLVEECEIPAGGSLVEYVDDMREKLEAAENNLIDSECHVAELEEALRDKQALLEASEKRIAELEAELVSQTYKLNELSGNSPVIPDGWISCSDRMPNEEDVLVYCSDTKEQMVGFHKGKGLFQFFYMNGVEGVCEPSHWMPLPEPPQEVNRG
ncbi:ead/Ea22-like family protein [Escherichia coli]